MIGNKKQKGKVIGSRNGIKIYSTLKAKKHINQMSSGKYKQTKEEQKLKQELLERCKGLCECCHRPPDFRGLSKHEIIFRSKGGNPLDKDNVLMLCGRCHSGKHGIKEKI